MTSALKITFVCASLIAASGAFAQKVGENMVSLGTGNIKLKTTA